MGIIIQKYKEGQETAVFRLIKKVYDAFVAVDYSSEGNTFFYDWIQPSKIAERQLNQNNIWLAFSGPELTGMIEIRENKFISLLFVDKNYQGQGIAKSLFDASLLEMRQRDAALEKVYVHASPFSVPVYRKMGFIETGIMCEENGIKYVPMEMIIKKQTQ